MGRINIRELLINVLTCRQRKTLTGCDQNGIVSRLFGFCYMDFDSPGKEAGPNPVCCWAHTMAKSNCLLSPTFENLADFPFGVNLLS